MIQLSLFDTALSLVPILLGIGIYYWHRYNTADLWLSSGRMVLQLITIGYLLTFLFDYELSWLGLCVMSFMLVVASIITIRPLEKKGMRLWATAFIALLIAGGFNLAWMLFVVLKLSPWYQPSIVISLAGMVFANGMNTLSVAAERYEQECKNNNANARKIAFDAAMIPQINTLLAVGLVSLPGMMTGQILSGVEPLLAVRYQVMIMSMVVSTSIISLAIYLWIQNRIPSP